jgi:hypothetical protein
MPTPNSIDASVNIFVSSCHRSFSIPRPIPTPTPIVIPAEGGLIKGEFPGREEKQNLLVFTPSRETVPPGAILLFENYYHPTSIRELRHYGYQLAHRLGKEQLEADQLVIRGDLDMPGR